MRNNTLQHNNSKDQSWKLENSKIPTAQVIYIYIYIYIYINILKESLEDQTKMQTCRAMQTLTIVSINIPALSKPLTDIKITTFLGDKYKK